MIKMHDTLEMRIFTFEDRQVIVGIRTHTKFGRVVYEQIKYKDKNRNDVDRFRAVDDVDGLYQQMITNYEGLANEHTDTR